jgi:methylated-DNA-[protein]-cysteine S-methyltransferase
MTHFFDTFAIPFGEFSVALDPDGAVVATAFGGEAALRGRFHLDRLIRDVRVVEEARREIDEYFAGERRSFTLRLAPGGTPFQRSVWSALSAIPLGATRSYGQLAAALGKPGAARAIGRANATNPVCLIVPCHRVIGADGSLTGFAFGEEIKRMLLEWEQATRGQGFAA